MTQENSIPGAGLEGTEMMSFSTERPFGLRAWVEDDGRVAYAYLASDEGIVADVWLYNRRVSAELPEWEAQTTQPPFLNHSRFAFDDYFAPIASPSEVSFQWQGVEARSTSVHVYIRGVLHAKLDYGVSPGASVQARLEGPLAKPLVREIPDAGGHRERHQST